MSIHLFDYLYDDVDMSTTTTFTMKSLKNNNILNYNNSMNFDFSYYQKQAEKYAIYRDEDKVLYPALGLASEAGEVCDKIKKAMRDRAGLDAANSSVDILRINSNERDAVLAELGDVLWYVAALATDFNADLSDIARANLDKLEDRMNRNKIKGSGDNR